MYGPRVSGLPLPSIPYSRVVEQWGSDFTTWPDVGESDGDIEIGGRDWTWEALVSETPDENIRRIDVSTYAGERQAAALSGFLPKP